MKRILIISFILLFVLSGCVIKEQKIKENYNNKLLINNIPISVEIVSGVFEMQRGLSGRDKMCENCGMLFIMTDLGIHHFWMNEMIFSLDFIYIENNKIVEIFKNVPVYTESDYTKINPTKNSDMVLELNAGFLDKNNIKIGDEIKLINN